MTENSAIIYLMILVVVYFGLCIYYYLQNILSLVMHVLLWSHRIHYLCQVQIVRIVAGAVAQPANAKTHLGLFVRGSRVGHNTLDEVVV